MLHHPGPGLGSAEVEHQGHLVVEGGLAGRKGLFGFGNRALRLPQKLHVFPVGQLLLHAPVERVGFNGAERLGGEARAAASFVDALDPAGPPAIGRLEEVAEHGGRGHLAVLAILPSQHHVPRRIHQDVDFVAEPGRVL